MERDGTNTDHHRVRKRRRLLAVISYPDDYSVVLGVFSTEGAAREAVSGYSGDPGDGMVHPVNIDVEVDIPV